MKSYTRRTKSGKTVTVKAYTAKYDAADAADASKREGAGGELDELKKKKKAETPDTGAYGEYGFNLEEFREWYEGTGSDADKKVEKLLRHKLGKETYTKINDLAVKNYKKGGEGKFFDSLHDVITNSQNAKKSKVNNGGSAQEKVIPSKRNGNGQTGGKTTKVPKVFKDDLDWVVEYTAYTPYNTNHYTDYKTTVYAKSLKQAGRLARKEAKANDAILTSIEANYSDRNVKIFKEMGLDASLLTKSPSSWYEKKKGEKKKE